MNKTIDTFIMAKEKIKDKVKIQKQPENKKYYPHRDNTKIVN